MSRARKLYLSEFLEKTYVVYYKIKLIEPNSISMVFDTITEAKNFLKDTAYYDCQISTITIKPYQIDIKLK